ncbi:MAG TPA: hypothetical protein VMW50_08480 [Dehalococcoidia bacterium]|nr:hypothetical protein [Dehalococcoidia bacterium]
MPQFSAMSPLNGGDFAHYYRDKEFPMDLNGALDFARPAIGIASFPFPIIIGHICGLLPTLNPQEYASMMGNTPGGMPVEFLNHPEYAFMAFPAINGGMVKVV